MPYVRVDPDLFLEHNGVEVYHMYDASGGEIASWFTLNPDNADEFFGHGNRGQFDARLLAARWETTPNVAQWEEFWRARFVSEEDAFEALVEQAIERGTMAQWKQS